MVDPPAWADQDTIEAPQTKTVKVEGRRPDPFRALGQSELGKESPTWGVRRGVEIGGEDDGVRRIAVADVVADHVSGRQTGCLRQILMRVVDPQNPTAHVVVET